MINFGVRIKEVIPANEPESRVPAGKPGSRYVNWFRGLGLTLILLGVLLGSLFYARDYWLPSFAHFLMVEDAPERVDAIVVLSGGAPWRNKVAGRLYHEGVSQKIITLGSDKNRFLFLALGLLLSSAEINAEILEKYCGVPHEAIILINKKVRGTFNEARALRQYIEKEDPLRSILIVTTDGHSRRAKWIFQKVFRDTSVEIWAREESYLYFDPDSWWRYEESLIAVFNEYIKFAYYLLKY